MMIPNIKQYPENLQLFTFLGLNCGEMCSV